MGVNVDDRIQYKGEFKDINDNIVCVEITQEGDGDITEVRELTFAGNSPVVITKNNSEELYQPITPTSATLNLVQTESRQYRDIVNLDSENNNKYQIAITQGEEKKIGGVANWVFHYTFYGYITSEDYEEDIISDGLPQLVSIEASCGLNLLKKRKGNIPYINIGDKVQVKDLIKKIISQIGYAQTEFYTALFPCLSTNDLPLSKDDFHNPFNDLYIDTSVFEGMTHYEIIESIMTAFGMTIVRDLLTDQFYPSHTRCNFLCIRFSDIVRGSTDYNQNLKVPICEDYYNTNNSEYSNTQIGTSENDDFFFVHGRQKIVQEKPVQSQTIDVEWKQRPNWIDSQDSNFENGLDNWAIGSSFYTYNEGVNVHTIPSYMKAGGGCIYPSGADIHTLGYQNENGDSYQSLITGNALKLGGINKVQDPRRYKSYDYSRNQMYTVKYRIELSDFYLNYNSIDELKIKFNYLALWHQHSTLSNYKQFLFCNIKFTADYGPDYTGVINDDVIGLTALKVMKGEEWGEADYYGHWAIGESFNIKYPYGGTDENDFEYSPWLGQGEISIDVNKAIELEKGFIEGSNNNFIDIWFMCGVPSEEQPSAPSKGGVLIDNIVCSVKESNTEEKQEFSGVITDSEFATEGKKIQTILGSKSDNRYVSSLIYKKDGTDYYDFHYLTYGDKDNQLWRDNQLAMKNLESVFSLRGTPSKKLYATIRYKDKPFPFATKLTTSDESGEFIPYSYEIDLKEAEIELKAIAPSGKIIRAE